MQIAVLFGIMVVGYLGIVCWLLSRRFVEVRVRLTCDYCGNIFDERTGVVVDESLPGIVFCCRGCLEAYIAGNKLN